MNAAFKRIKPAQLPREILRMTGELEKLSLTKKRTLPKPPVGNTWKKAP